MNQQNEYIECGSVSTTHGINGAVKVRSLCNTPEDLASLSTLYLPKLGVYRKLEVKEASVYKDIVIFSFEGISSIDSAAALKGKTLYALREDFPLDEGEYFIADIIGLEVRDAVSGKLYGKVSGINTNTPQMLYEVETESGIKLLPAVDAFIKEIDLDNGISVTPIPGLLED